ncbi:putative voltage-gated ClC-type chloride channel ClcB [Planctomycetes bacterium Pan216]|uniref:Putative voltage-gated ClC-type chloride channel ClcB n=1 Tax=Kolteria novifilia TaxID=2527975 RepID=A0A518AYM1_9BACT|nr:putative voltage-gated ClC-type chloride channel ClcB [Planctomycetes bacterium Pan216]
MESTLTLSLGLIFAAGMIAKWLSSRFHIPKVTLYLLAGFLLGPPLLGWIPKDDLKSLLPAVKLALGLVLFDLGSRFVLHDVRMIFRHAWRLSALELAATFGLVFLGTTLFVDDITVALLLGGLAMTTAPATTILVLNELDSDGPITNYTYALVAINNTVSVLFFEFLFLGVELFGEGGPAPLSVSEQVIRLFLDLGGSILLGFVAGMTISLLMEWLDEHQRMIALFALIALPLGVCEYFGIPYLLTFLAAGVTVANSSPFVREIVAQLEKVGVLIYVAFFVTAGAKLHLDGLWTAGMVGVAYIVCRSAGKYFGLRFAAASQGEPPPVYRWLGVVMLCQGSAAIALTQLIVERDAELGATIEVVVLGAVAFFELAGPIAARSALVRGGEVPLIHVVHPHGPSWRDRLFTILDQLQLSFGRSPERLRKQGDVTVEHLMRRNVRAVSSTASFLDLMHFIEESRYDTYPVVGPEQDLVGVIRYPSIRSAIFDPEMAHLVIAADLAVPTRTVLRPSQPIKEALALFERGFWDVIPVVSEESPGQLVGLVERRDVIRVARDRYTRSASKSLDLRHET